MSQDSPTIAPAGSAPSAIAIIGMAGRFPGAPDIDNLWRLSCEGREGITFFTPEELAAAGVDPAVAADPRYVRGTGFLTGATSFDATFFGYAPREAETIDPQQRLFLETAWAALEDAGYRPDGCPFPVGVFASVGFPLYLLHLAPQGRVSDFDALLGNDKDFLATRVSYKLGLSGPSLTVQAACSSSLAAVHLACQSLQSGECDLALVGGARIHTFRPEGYLYREGGVLSPDGRCRPFDARAGGSVAGSGAGAVVLRRLSEAIAVGDNVRAVILGSAINNDGATKLGFTAPSVDGQAAAIAEALAVSGVYPQSVGYLETHGTATPLGDPIEVAALKQAFGPAPSGPWCALGSVKANIGHLDAAAGVTGLIKAALCIQRGVRPPLLHFEHPNPECGLPGSAFYAPTTLSAWTTPPGQRRLAGVSSFGMGGTNVHVVLEQAPDESLRSGPAKSPRSGPAKSAKTTPAGEEDRRSFHLIVVSAKTPTALAASAARLATRLRARPGEPDPPRLEDAAYTLQVGRKPLAHRVAVVAKDNASLAEALIPIGKGEEESRPAHGLVPPETAPTFSRATDPGTPSREEAVVLAGVASTSQPPHLVFLFPGQGAQYLGMARNLYESEPVFRAEFDHLADLFRPHLDFDLTSFILGDGPAGRTTAAARVEETALVQPAVFSVEMALVRLWEAWGVRPQAMAGHSIGELTAAAVAGVFDLETAVTLVAARGRLVQALPGGAMLSIPYPETRVRELLAHHPELSLAAVNAPQSCVVSGPVEAVRSLEESLTARGVDCRRLRVSHAFHSPCLAPAARAFGEEVARAKLHPPRLPYLSNVTGDWITAKEAIDPGYWATHLLKTVRFGDNAHKLLTGSGSLFLEVGPGRTLGVLLRQAFDGLPQGGRPPRIVGSLRHPQDSRPDDQFLLAALGRLWVAGVEVDWAAYQRGRFRRRVSLPAYPFEGRRFWSAGEIGLPAREGRSTEDAAEAGVSPAAAGVSPTMDAPDLSEGHPRPDLSTPFVAPRDELERAIATIWENVLGLQGVGVNDDLFELGGHSLIATQIATRLQGLFQIDLPLRAVFEAATIARLAGIVRERLGAGRGAGRTPSPVEKLPTGPESSGRPLARSPVPASFGQQRLWFLDRLSPGSSAYNLPVGLHLRGPLDLGALSSALSEIARRHETLRTTFAMTGGLLIQIVRPATPVELPVVDLSGPPASPVSSTLDRLVAEEAGRPFDLEAGPVWRARLFRKGRNDHVLLLTIHHLAADGWSWGVLVREISALYEAFRQGRPAPLPELTLQYSGYALWQQTFLSPDRLASESAFWRERLAGDLPVLELPADQPRPPVQSLKGESLSRLLPASALGGLEKLARAQGATPFMVLLAGFKALLHHYTGETDIIVGTPVANRARPEFESLIGFFVNTLALRTNLGGEPTFSELLGRVRETTLDAYAHQDLPFERLVSEIVVGRDLAHTPIFQIMFVYQNAPVSEMRLPGLEVEVFSPPTGSAKFDLSLTLEPRPDGLEMQAEYVAGVFAPETIDRLLDHYETLLRSALDAPETRLSDLRVLLPRERLALEAWNATAKPVAGKESLLGELIRQQAARAPEAVAIAWEGGEITYGELISSAGGLAGRLAALGAGPDSVIGVLTERSPEMVIALLGVLLAGGAYLPLSPGYPPARLSFMLANAGARILLTTPDLRDGEAARLAAQANERSTAAQANEGLTVVTVDRAAPPASADAGLTRPGPDNLAYVIYTSGSTGAPKGVLLPHRGIVDRLLHLRETYHIGPEDRFLQTTAYTFDISLYEIFLPLVVGGRIVLAAPGGQRDPAYLVRLIQSSGATFAQFVPSMLARFIEERGAGNCSTLRKVFALGEALPPETCRRFLALGLGAELHNLYGPTEATVHATAWPCPDGRSGGRAFDQETVVPIGKPAPNVQAWVLGPRLSRKPPGAPGEIYLGGVGLARGYAARPDLTAETFLPNPYGGSPGDRLYRTGDRGRFLANGDIEFLGRLDHQVKIRGFRVEPGEIEMALADHPAVSSVVVTAQTHGPAEGRLLAYLAPKPDTPPDELSAANLRDYLRGRLPEYMIPSVFISLPHLPLSPNGKVDRRALPAPDVDRLQPGTAFEAPRTPVEEAVASTWREILALQKVGVNDDFFDFGGHSLLAVQVISRLSDTYGVNLGLTEFFATPTVAGLAQAIQTALAARPSPADDDRPQTAGPGDLRPEDIDTLSEQEIDALLAQIAAEEGADSQ
jgi:amino acid adenylation domain-containing protein